MTRNRIKKKKDTLYNFVRACGNSLNRFYSVGQRIVAVTCWLIVVLMSKSLFPLTGLLLACSLLYPDYFLACLIGQIIIIIIFKQMICRLA